MGAQAGRCSGAAWNKHWLGAGRLEAPHQRGQVAPLQGAVAARQVGRVGPHAPHRHPLAKRLRGAASRSRPGCSWWQGAKPRAGYGRQCCQAAAAAAPLLPPGAAPGWRRACAPPTACVCHQSPQRPAGQPGQTQAAPAAGPTRAGSCEPGPGAAACTQQPGRLLPTSKQPPAAPAAAHLLVCIVRNLVVVPHADEGAAAVQLLQRGVGPAAGRGAAGRRGGTRPALAARPHARRCVQPPIATAAPPVAGIAVPEILQRLAVVLGAQAVPGLRRGGRGAVGRAGVTQPGAPAAHRAGQRRPHLEAARGVGALLVLVDVVCGARRGEGWEEGFCG